MFDFSLSRILEISEIFLFWMGVTAILLLILYAFDKVNAIAKSYVKHNKNIEKCEYGHTNSVEKCDVDYSYLLDPDYYGDWYDK